MHVSKLDDLERFTTLDGSTICEIVGPAWTPARNQSPAEAPAPRVGSPAPHFPREAEELSFSTAGRGGLRVGDLERDVAPGEFAVIPPGTVHKLWNIGEDDLVLLCCCAPAYSHEDTVLVEDA